MIYLCCLALVGLIDRPLALRSELAELVHADRSAFQFSIVNNASVPLNFLALPKLANVYAHTQNRVQPGGKFSFRAALGAYDIHVIIHDGQNAWYQATETSWGLSKEGLAFTVSAIANGAGLGSLAVGAAAIATAGLSAVAAGPLLITLGAQAAFWGVTAFSSMACSYLADQSVEYLRQQLADVEHKTTNATNARDLMRHESGMQLLDLSQNFKAREDSAVFEDGVKYLCCCRKSTNLADASCELCRADGPSKTWFSSGCPNLAGDGYMPWWKSAGGRCLVTRSPFSPSADGPDRLVPFKTVVREGTVRDAFSVSFPDLNVEYVLMTMATAERYLASMQSRFSQWKAIRGAERRFVIAGGFMNPSKMPRTTQDEPWTVIEFMPLQMGEITPAYGCRVPGDDAFWQTQATKCRNQCKDPECVDSCIQPFKQALDQEVSTRQTFRALDIPASSKAFVVENKSIIEEASTKALVPVAENLDEVLGKTGSVLKVDLQLLTATVLVNSMTLTLPMEALRLAENQKQPEHPMLSAWDRAQLAAPRFGQCWSSCSGRSWTSTALSGFKQAVTLGGSDLWCFTANKTRASGLQAWLGSLCLEDDECPHLATQAAQDAATNEATCVDTCI